MTDDEDTQMTRPMQMFRERVRDETGLGLVEVLVSMIILSVGVLAIAGISLQVGTLNALSTSQTDQSLAAQQVMESMQAAGYANASSGSDTITVANRRYVVTTSVTTPSLRVKLVQLTVTAAGNRGRQISAGVYTGRIYDARQLPSAP
jgi:Tfp pilus assembly protein PilV